MNTRIVVITGRYLYFSVKEAFARIKPDCHIKVVSYDNFTTISNTYDIYAAEADGFLVSGYMAKAAIEAVEHEIKRPIGAFNIDTAGLYRTILNLLLENRSLDMNRVILDFLIPVGRRITANTFLQDMTGGSVPFRFDSWAKTLTAKKIQAIETSVVCEVVRLWNEGAIDQVVCQYSSIVPALKGYGIPCIFPQPTDARLEEMTQELLSAVELEQMRANLPVIVNAAPRRREDLTPDSIHLLKGYMDEFFKTNLIDSVTQEGTEHCSTVTTLTMLRYITKDGTSCKLTAFLKQKTGFAVAVGYGIGVNFNAAIKNSYGARREAAFAGDSFIQNENGDLIGPLDSANWMTLENHSIQYISSIAKKCNLSTITIKKVLAILKLNSSDKLTTHQLSDRLGCTVRNANRILQNLENAGYAKIVYTQTNNSKGRPTKVYELKFKL